MFTIENDESLELVLHIRDLLLEENINYHLTNKIHQLVNSFSYSDGHIRNYNAIKIIKEIVILLSDDDVSGALATINKSLRKHKINLLKIDGLLD